MKKKTVNKNTTSAPTRRALLVSVAAHAVLLCALAVVGYETVPSVTDAPGVLTIAVVPFFDGTGGEPEAVAADDADTAADTETVPPVPVAEIEELAEPPRQEAPSAEPVDALAAASPEPAVADETEPPRPPEDAEPDAGRAGIAAAAPVEPALPFEPERARSETPAEPQLADSASEPVELVPPQSAAAEPELVSRETAEPVPVEPVSATERELLERRVTDWAKSFAALGDWQPTTTWTDKGQEYAATVTRLPATGSMGLEEAVVTVSTELDGESVSTEMRMQRLSFSHFAQFIDRWDDQVQIHDDVIDGRFHSNSEIYIEHSGGVQPMFTGKVTTARGINTSRSQRSVRRNEVFLGGLETRAGRITLPRRVALFTEDDAVDPARVHRFATTSRIEFLADGSYVWTEIDTGRRRDREAKAGDAAVANAQRRRLTDEPYYLLAGEDAALHLSGVVNGRVLVYSPEDIVIEGDLEYAADPRLDPGSDDYLGLVSEESVAIAPSDVTGPGDLEVQAAIYARQQFAVRGYRSRAAGTLRIHGSVTAGSVTATEPRYRTELTFDTRLAERRPPRFPQTDRFEITDWDAEWVLR